MMTTEQKPGELLCCPFCGGEPKYEMSPAGTDFSRHANYWVHCTQCEEVFQISRKSQEDVIMRIKNTIAKAELWNRNCRSKLASNLALKLAEIHMGDGDELGSMARELIDLIGKGKMYFWMKLWLLRPVEGLSDKDNPWVPWCDKAHGFVIRAKTEEEARKMANEEGKPEVGPWKGDPWLNAKYSLCVELIPEGEDGVIICDYQGG